MTTFIRFLKSGLIWLARAGFLGLVILLGWRTWLNLVYSPRIYTSLAEVPDRRVALVFGAGLQRGRPSAVLADRIEAAAALYHAGKVDKLLLSGDNRFINYNEPAVMKAYAEELQVPAEDIVLDYAGRRTYDSCYRARAIFAVKEAVLVSQGFHLARAAYLCDSLGVEPTGFVADRRSYLKRLRWWWEVRETLATAAAWWDIHVARPLPVLGEPIPVVQEKPLSASR